MEQGLEGLMLGRFGLAEGGGESVEPALARILARRTHRRYAPRAVPEALLAQLLAAALSASSKSDYQQATILRLA